jgi:hypothetical protein
MIGWLCHSELIPESGILNLQKILKQVQDDNYHATFLTTG